MPDSQRFGIKVPKTHKIAYSEFEVAGLFAHLDELEKALAPGDASFVLNREPDNPYDKNAIAVKVRREGFFGTKFHMIGYLPKDIAAEIAQKGDFENLMFRPKTLWEGDSKTMKFYADLLGPK